MSPSTGTALWLESVPTGVLPRTESILMVCGEGRWLYSGDRKVLGRGIPSFSRHLSLDGCKFLKRKAVPKLMTSYSTCRPRC